MIQFLGHYCPHLLWCSDSDSPFEYGQGTESQDSDSPYILRLNALSILKLKP